MAVLAIAIARQTNLFAAIMMTSIFSLVSAGVLLILDAVDVAFTEAAVGAGISTVLMLGALAQTKYSKNGEIKRHRPSIFPLIVVVLTGSALIYGTSDMPRWGDPNSPAQTHLRDMFIQGSQQLDIPNVVTTVLASYRGYDTLGEVTVIFTAAIGVILLLGMQPKRSTHHEGKENDRTALGEPSLASAAVDASSVSSDADQAQSPKIGTSIGSEVGSDT